MRPGASDAAARSARPVLIVNPNSNPAVSDLVRAAADRTLPADVQWEVVNPPDGPLSIETDRHKAEAVPRVLDLVRSAGAENYGAVVMACFDDLALAELRGEVPVPVVGTFEAGIMRARSCAGRLGIVTTFEGALPDIRRLIEKYGVSDCVSLRAAGVGVAAAAEPDASAAEKIERTVREAIERDGAQAVLLGSGGLTGWACTLSKKFEAPVIDGVESAVRIAGAFAFDARRPAFQRDRP